MAFVNAALLSIVLPSGLATMLLLVLPVCTPTTLSLDLLLAESGQETEPAKVHRRRHNTNDPGAGKIIEHEAARANTGG